MGKKEYARIILSIALWILVGYYLGMKSALLVFAITLSVCLLYIFLMIGIREVWNNWGKAGEILLGSGLALAMAAFPFFGSTIHRFLGGE